MESNSKRFILNKTDWVKIGKGLLLAISGAVLTYITAVLKIVPLGEFTPAVMLFWSVLANVIRKWVADYCEEVQPPIEPTV